MGDADGRSDFERLVPSWMFVLRRPSARLLTAVLVPLVAAVPLVLASDPSDLRFGPFLVVPIVVVAAVGGWWATAIAAAIVTGVGWWYAIPAERSFRLDHLHDAVGVGSLLAVGAGVTLLTWQVQRSVADVRALVADRRAQAERESAGRQEAEQAVTLGQAVLALSNRLAGARTMAEVATEAVDNIDVPVWPTTASVAIVEDGRLRVLAARGASLDSVRGLERVDLATSSWLGDVLAGEPAIVDDREQFAAAHPDARVLRIYPSGSWAVIPFRSESTVGLLSLYYLGPHALRAHAPHFALVAEILATALERAQAEERRQEQMTALAGAFAERDRIARTLSTTLLPPALPRLPGCSTAAWLVPASSDEVAGDFYDVFSVGDGDWVAVLGDVCGKGAEAAAVTSLARYAARVTALTEPDADRIAEVANAALGEDPSELFCTMAIARYRAAEGRLEIVLAGHPEVRVVRPDRVDRVGTYGGALGYATKPYAVDLVPFGPGDALVLHSDGLVERDGSFGDDELDGLLGGLAGAPAQAVADGVRDRIEQVPPTRRDDLTLLVVSCDGAV